MAANCLGSGPAQPPPWIRITSRLAGRPPAGGLSSAWAPPGPAQDAGRTTSPEPGEVVPAFPHPPAATAMAPIATARRTRPGAVRLPAARGRGPLVGMD